MHTTSFLSHLCSAKSKVWLHPLTFALYPLGSHLSSRDSCQLSPEGAGFSTQTTWHRDPSAASLTTVVLFSLYQEALQMNFMMGNLVRNTEISLGRQPRKRYHESPEVRSLSERKLCEGVADGELLLSCRTERILCVACQW